MEQSLVSVVIPIYNVEKYLNRCVDSIVNQTYRNLEIILVDDGSPDRCPELCDAWARKDRRIRVIHKENAGLGMARNSGLELASGKYICFFDSDDYVDITIIEKCVKNAEEYCSDAVIFGCWSVDEDGKTTRKMIDHSRYLYRGDEIRELLLPGMFTYQFGFGISAWGKLYRRELFSEFGLVFRSEREIISEDAYFALEFYGKASVVTIVPENLYFYLNRSSSLSRVFRPDRQKKNDVFLNNSLEFIADTGLPDMVARHLTARYHFYTIAAMKQLMMSDLTEEQKRKALEEIFRSPTLRATLSADVLALEKPAMRLFFCSLKLRQHWLCRMMLKYKIKN